MTKENNPIKLTDFFVDCFISGRWALIDRKRNQTLFKHNNITHLNVIQKEGDRSSEAMTGKEQVSMSYCNKFNHP